MPLGLDRPQQVCSARGLLETQFLPGGSLINVRLGMSGFKRMQASLKTASPFSSPPGVQTLDHGWSV